MLSHPNGKSIMMDARLHPVNEPKKSHQPLLCNVLGIIVITEETAANREHQLTERRGNMFKLILCHLLYKRKSERKVKLKKQVFCLFVHFVLLLYLYIYDVFAEISRSGHSFFVAVGTGT
jgi:hypothetical protein